MISPLPPEQSVCPFARFAIQQRTRIIGEILAELPHRHQAVLGLHCGASWSLAEIARYAGLSRQSVWEIKQEALAELRRRLAARRITRSSEL